MGALAAFAASATLAIASGPGRGGGDDDFDDHLGDTTDTSDTPDVDSSEPSDASDTSEDNSGHGGGDDEGASADESDDSLDEGSTPGSDDGSEGSDSNSGDDGSNSGSGSSDDGNDTGSGDDGGGSNSGSSGSGSGSGGDDDGEEDSGGGNSGSGSGDDGGSNSGSGSSGSGSGGEEHSGSNSGSNSGSQHASTDPNESSGGTNQALIVEHDEHGDERLTGEALLTGSQGDIEAAIQAGYTPISQQALSSMDCYIVRLALPVGMGVDAGVAELRALAPHAIVAANTVYHSSQANIAVAPASRHGAPTPVRGVMGVIDTGVDPASLGEGVVMSQRAFAAASPTAREHGSAVVALAAEHGMRMHVADVFARSATGEQIASAESIAAALDWMMSNNVAVINVSIEGPNNPVLQALVRRAHEHGFVVVAAAGNGGPAARPAFPAAFEGSLAVTAIDGRDRPYFRANRGGYIDFAAQGVDISVSTGNESLLVSGTSFSAPLVAAQIAARLRSPSPERARAIVDELRRDADDLGAPGHDPIFGWGAIRD